MKRLLSFILLSLIFLFEAFSAPAQPLSQGLLFKYTIDLNGGSIYVDDSGQSFFYGSSFNLKAEKSQNQFFLTAAYTGLSSDELAATEGFEAVEFSNLDEFFYLLKGHQEVKIV